MITASLIRDLQSRGVRFETQGERMKVDAPEGVLTPEIRTMLARYKAELLAALRTNSHYQHQYQERAAIYEYDAGHCRADAERLAFQDLLADYVRERYPAIYAQVETITRQEAIH